MAKNMYRGDAPAIAQISRLNNLGTGAVTISCNGKTLGNWSEFDPEGIVSVWNASNIPEFREVIPSVAGDSVLLTARTPGVPFWISVMFASDEGNNAKQLIKMIHGPTGGTYTLTYKGETTVPIAYNANAAAVLLALAALTAYQLGDILTEDTPEGVIVEFGGRNAGLKVDPLEINGSGLRGGNASITVQQIRPYSLGVNEVQRITITDATGGTWALSLADETVIGATLAHNISAGTLEDALEAELGVGNVTVTGISSGVFDVEFLGDLAETPQELMRVNYSNLTPTQGNDIWQIDTRWDDGGAIWATDEMLGFFYLYAPGVALDSYAILEEDGGSSFNTAIRAVLDEYFGVGNYVIRKDVGAVDGLYEVELAGDLAGESSLPPVAMNWYPVVEDEEVGETPTASVSVFRESVKGYPEKQLFIVPPASSGQIRFRFGAINTAILNHDFGATQLQSALNSVFGSGTVSVSGNRNNGFEVTYSKSLGDVPLPEVSLNTLVFLKQITVNYLTDQFHFEMIVSQGNLAGGTYIIAGHPLYDDSPTINVHCNWNDSASEVQAKIAAAFSQIGYTATVQVSGNLHEEKRIEISADPVWLPVGGGSELWHLAVNHTALVFSETVSVTTTQLYVKGQNEIARIALDHEPGGGSFVLGWNGHSVTIPGLDFQGSISSYLAALPGLYGNHIVRLASAAGSWFAWDVEFIGLYEEENAPDFSIVSSALTPKRTAYGGNMLQPVSEKTQTGQDAANVKIARQSAGAPEQGEQQLILIIGEPHHGTWIALMDGDSTSAIQFDASAGTVESEFESLIPVGNGNVTVTGDHQEGWLLDFDISLGDVPDITFSHTFSNARGEIEILTPGGTSAFETLQESRGPEHYDDPLNWTLNRIPGAGDEVIFETGTVGPKYGLLQASTFTTESSNGRLFCEVNFRLGQKVRVQTMGGSPPAGLSTSVEYYVVGMDRNMGWIQLSATADGDPIVPSNNGSGTHYVYSAINSIVQHNRFTGPVGLPLRNTSNYYEYRPRYLVMAFRPAGPKLMEIGRGEGTGPGLMRFHVPFGPIELSVFTTGSSSESGTPTLNLICSNEDANLRYYDGDCGLAYFEGEEATIKTITKRGGELRGGVIYFAENGSISHDGGFPQFRKLYADDGVLIAQDA